MSLHASSTNNVRSRNDAVGLQLAAPMRRGATRDQEMTERRMMGMTHQSLRRRNFGGSMARNVVLSGAGVFRSGGRAATNTAPRMNPSMIQDGVFDSFDRDGG